MRLLHNVVKAKNVEQFQAKNAEVEGQWKWLVFTIVHFFGGKK